MRDLCMRSACQGAADVLVVMDVTELTFTLHDLAEVDGPGAVVLCSTHLARLVAPVGWRLVDDRGGAELIPLPEQPLALAEDEASEELVDAGDAVALRPVAAVHPLEAARAAHEANRAERVTESGSGPDAEATPLLARAFQGVERHPAAGTADDALAPVASVDEVDGPVAWDQTDVMDEREYTPAGEQLTFGSEPGA